MLKNQYKCCFYSATTQGRALMNSLLHRGRIIIQRVGSYGRRKTGETGKHSQRKARTNNKNNKQMRQASAVTTTLPLPPRINKHSSRGNGHFKGKMEKRWVILKLPTFPCSVSCGRVLCIILEHYLSYPIRQALSFLSRSLCIIGLFCAIFSVLRLLFCISKNFFMMFRRTEDRGQRLYCGSKTTTNFY